MGILLILNNGRDCMKFITGFFMAWGNFLALPCPYKKWDSSLNNIMLAFLPSIGLIIGTLWMLLYLLLAKLGAPLILGSFIMMFYVFAICGFMHLDGFMDCNDAILSRRSLEERQRILKDSNIGAFSVVTLVFLLIGFFSAMMSAIVNLEIWNLMIIPILSRGCAGFSVLTFKPMGHSQYAFDYGKAGRGKYRWIVVFQMIIFIGAAAVLSQSYVRILACAAIVVAVSFAASIYARKQLGGMSGDIAGYIICIGEFAGILTLALV